MEEQKERGLLLRGKEGGGRTREGKGGKWKGMEGIAPGPPTF